MSDELSLGVLPAMSVLFLKNRKIAWNLLTASSSIQIY